MTTMNYAVLAGIFVPGIFLLWWQFGWVGIVQAVIFTAVFVWIGQQDPKLGGPAVGIMAAAAAWLVTVAPLALYYRIRLFWVRRSTPRIWGRP